jgi:hypothetical protein
MALTPATTVRRAQLQPRATRHGKTAAGREWAATLALVSHYHRELRLSRKAFSPGGRLGGDHPPTLPASTHLEGNLATMAAAVG